MISGILENLSNYHSSNKLKDAVQTYITSQLMSVKDIKLLREVFRTLDKDGDGKISKDELFKAYQHTVEGFQSKEDMSRIMRQVSTDGNEHINYTEFLKATLDNRKVMSRENLKSAFRMFDNDGSGFISPNELKRVLEGDSNTDEQIWEDFIRIIDQNGDGEIDMQEFQDIILSKA